MTKFVKLVVTVPETHADLVRNAMGEVGAGKLGNYKFCSVSVKCVGRFLPIEGANPAVGSVGELESVNEERIEVTCERVILTQVINAIKKVHPYEEVVIDVYPIEEI